MLLLPRALRASLLLAAVFAVASAASFRANVGGPTINSIGFEADPTRHLVSAQTAPFSVTPGSVVTPGTWAPVYNGYRYAITGNLEYSVPVPDGPFAVAVMFAETYRPTGVVGGRVFSVIINGEVKRANLDVFASVGFNAPLYLRFADITPVDGRITITLARIPGKENPMLSAFVITGPGATDLTGAASGPAPPPSPPAPTTPVTTAPAATTASTAAPAPGSDPACATGVIGTNLATNLAACCPSVCGTCGGLGCNTRVPGTPCCISSVHSSSPPCTASGPPCVLPAPTEPTPPPAVPATPSPPDPACATGILGRNEAAGELACCVTECRQCGGGGCANFSPGNQCCISSITRTGRSCNDFAPPCVPDESSLPRTSAPPTLPTAPPPTTVSCDVSGATTTSFRMNIAGGAIGSADMGADNVDYITSPTKGILSVTSPATPISAASGPESWDAAYATHRWTMASVLTYKIPVPAGSYDVRLLFAETFFTKPNLRIFDIFINGLEMRRDLDVFKAVGQNVGLALTFPGITPNAGGITITLIKTKENPMISGILIDGPGAGSQAVGGGCSLDDDGAGGGDLNNGFNHRSHSVPGGPYIATDFNKNGRASVSLDGTQSHSHFSDPGPPEVTGTIVSYKWTWTEMVDGVPVQNTNNDRSGKFTAEFPLGTTIITLEVVDSTGDVASDTAEIEVRASTADGAYCYSYDFGDQSFETVPLGISLRAGPRPLVGGRTARINFNSAADFGNFNFPSNAFAMRCVFFFDAPRDGPYEFAIQHNGPVKLYNRGTIFAQSDSRGTTRTSKLNLEAGLSSFQLVYFRPQNLAPRLTLSNSDGSPIPPDRLQHDVSATLPVIRGLSRSTSAPAGGSNIQIFGSAFINGVSVMFGDVDASNLVTSEAGVVQVTVPEGFGEVSLTVVTNAGVSNAVPFTYTSGTTLNQPVVFRQTTLKDENGDDYQISFIAAATFGPDGRLYLGSSANRVHALGVDRQYRVTSLCTRTVGMRRAVLGVAFSPFTHRLRLYFTTSGLYWKDRNTFGFEEGWTNGKIETIDFNRDHVVDDAEAGESCAGNQKVLVSGLPVSNHDHGINKLQFLPDGRLLVGVGGFTNGGFSVPGGKPVPGDAEDDALGGVASNPLSAAIVSCPADRVTNIVYDNYENPEIARVIEGRECFVYASGLRNSFGMTIHSNGNLYALDNGPNAGFGDFSTDCDGGTVPGRNIPDRLFLVEEGKFHGHPNLNRRECEHYPASAVQAIVGNVRSSTNGIIEYRSNTFGGDIKGNLYLSRFAVQNSGLVAQVKLAGNGRPLPNGGYVPEFLPSSGLSLVEGPRGELIMPRVYQSEIIVNYPTYPTPDVTFMLGVHPKQGPSTGGTRVLISGHNFGTEPKAMFGGNECRNVVVLDDESFTCVTPSNSQNLQVAVVVTGRAGDSPTYGTDFWYY